MNYKDYIRQVPDFPKTGILFYDIATLMAEGPVWHQATADLAAKVAHTKPDLVIGIESRGFIFGAAVAEKLGVGMVMARKPGKLPGDTLAHSYALEYGHNTIELQTGIIKPKQKILVIDDVLATGGTAAAAITLAQKLGAEVVHAGFLIELTFLKGYQRLSVPYTSLITYDS